MNSIPITVIDRAITHRDNFQRSLINEHKRRLKKVEKKRQTLASAPLMPATSNIRPTNQSAPLTANDNPRNLKRRGGVLIMASAKQIAANRANAKRSTGPKSTAGHAKSSRNAYRHGLSQGLPLHDPAVRARMDAIAEALLAGEEPTEENLVRQRRPQLRRPSSCTFIRSDRTC